jgi:2'-5' RNA ligase
MSTDESALVVLVPAAESLVRPFRDRYDPSAALGVPAHITLLYPFKPPEQIDGAVITRLHEGFARFAPIIFSLASISRFPDVIYLAPDPAEPFRELTRAIWSWFPETPPYGGKWPDIVPHLSIASIADEHELQRIAEELARASRDVLPISAAANEVTLLEQRGDRWNIRTAFRLGRI